MRLVDVCIPHFGDDTPKKSQVPRAPKSDFPLPPLPPTFTIPGVFRAQETAYMVEDQPSITEKDGEGDKGEESFEAPSENTDVSLSSRSPLSRPANEKKCKSPKIHQHTFELSFQVQKLRAALFRSASDGTERPLGDVTFERFALGFALAKYDMSVDIDLRFVAHRSVCLIALTRHSD